MYISIDYIQNFVPTIYTRDYANMSITNGDFIAETNCSNMSDALHI
jgi:hypothetical protein